MKKEPNSIVYVKASSLVVGDSFYYLGEQITILEIRSNDQTFETIGICVETNQKKSINFVQGSFIWKIIS